MRTVRFVAVGIMSVVVMALAPPSSAIGVEEDDGDISIVGCVGDLPVQPPGGCPNPTIPVGSVLDQMEGGGLGADLIQAAEDLHSDIEIYAGLGLGHFAEYRQICYHVVAKYQDNGANTDKRCVAPV